MVGLDIALAIGGVRSSAAFALGNLGKASEAVVNALLVKLEDEYLWVHLSTTHALGKLGETSEEVVTALLAKLEDTDCFEGIEGIESSRLRVVPPCAAAN